MKISLRKALEVSGLSEAKILAGEEKLDDVFIDSVTTIEVTDDTIGDWIEENQLCISAMYAIRDNLEQQLNLVRILHERKCAGLIICHVGIWIKELEKELVALCRELSLPLIKPAKNINYLDILNPLICCLMEDRASEVSYGGLDGEILDMVIRGESLTNLFKKITEHYQCKATYLDAYGNCLYSNEEWKKVETEKSFIRQNFNQVFARLLQDKYLEMEIQQGLPPKLICLVQSKNNIFGFLFLDYLDQAQKDTLTQLAKTWNTVCVLTTGRKTRKLQIKEYYVQEYVTDLLVWNFRTEEEAIMKGREAGFSLEGKNLFLIINLNEARNVETFDEGSPYAEQIKMHILPSVREICNRVDSESVIHLRSDQILILMEVKSETSEVYKRLEEIRGKFMKYGVSVSIGVSEFFARLPEIPAAYNQAVQAAIMGRHYYGENQIIAYESIYFLQEIRKLGEREEAHNYSRKMLAPLIEYDERHNTDFLETLVFLLKYNGDVIRTAREMHLHRNTVLYRRKKMIEMFGYSPFDMPWQLNILVALGVINKL